MIKKIVKYLSYLFIPLFITIIAANQYESFLDHKIQTEYNAALGRTYGVDEMNKGLAILKNNIVKDDVMLFGSSELANDSIDISTHPSHMFPNTDLNRDVCLVGRAGTQSLLHAMKMGTVADGAKDNKFVFIVSPQWFFGDESSEKQYFQAHFSEIQFYDFMDNGVISDDIKKHACNRIVNLVGENSALQVPCFYAYIHRSDNWLFKCAQVLFEPYYFVRRKFVKLKDKHDAYKAIKRFKDNPAQNVKEVDWPNEMKQAQQNGEKSCTNNNFYAYDSYYTKYLQSNLESLKDCYKDIDLCKSKEMDDYVAALKIFKEMGIKPYIVIASTNGYYYDYTGLTRDKRAKLYDQIAQYAKAYGMDYLDLRDFEYEPYFYKDVMHLGWKGWVYIDEKNCETFFINP